MDPTPVAIVRSMWHYRTWRLGV